MRQFFPFCFCIAITASNAQSFDDIISSHRYIDCADVAFNATDIISKLYAQNRVDSMYQFLDYWEGKCGFMEPAYRLRTILDIKTGRLNPDSISSSCIELLMAYKRSRYFPALSPYDLAGEKKKFDSLTSQIAFETSSEQIDGSLILNFYSSEYPSFQQIKSAPDSSRLKLLYHTTYLKTLRMPELHLAFAFGLVQNYGNISIFGSRPNFGMLVGGKRLRHNCDLVLDFRAGPSKDKYSFLYQDSLITGNTWTGLYFGLEYTFDFISRPKIDLGLSTGLGFDGITALTADNEYGKDPKSLPSFNKNIGIVFKYKFGKNGRYMGLHLRFNWADYNNPGGTQLDGEYLNLRVTVGSIYDYWRNSRLETLE